MALYPAFRETLDQRELSGRTVNVVEAEAWVKADCETKKDISGQLMDAGLSVDKFLENLKSQQPRGTAEIALDSKELVNLMSSLKMMSKEILDRQEELSGFWPGHKAEMDHMIRMCYFNDKVEKVCNYIC